MYLLIHARIEPCHNYWDLLYYANDLKLDNQHRVTCFPVQWWDLCCVSNVCVCRLKRKMSDVKLIGQEAITFSTMGLDCFVSWWCYDVEMLPERQSLCEGNPPAIGGFLHKWCEIDRAGGNHIQYNGTGLFCIMMMLWHGNASQTTVPLWGESTSHWWIPSQRHSNVELCCFLCYWSEHPLMTKNIVIDGKLYIILYLFQWACRFFTQ